MTSEKYITRCQKTLKSWNAPLENWICSRVIDVKEDDSDVDFFTCELCGCEKVRYIHMMEHEMYFEEVSVGCICAGIMEGDIIAAKERDRKMKNRAARRRNFVKKEWNTARNGNKYLRYRDHTIFINHSDRQLFSVNCDGRIIRSYKKKPINNFLSAVYAAFDAADPIEEVMN